MFMLVRNRSSRAMSKPTIMADHSSSQQSPKQNYYARNVLPSLFGSSKFRDFTNKSLSGTDALKSPTSILDTRPFSPFANPFSYPNKIKTFPHKISSENISKGLALVGALQDDPVDHNSLEPNKGNVLLRVKIPTLSPFSSFSPFRPQTYALDFGTPNSGNSPQSGGFANAVALNEVEHSEEYTCVISHGPKPRTTHIFNNCIVLDSYFSLPKKPSFDPSNFLSFCHTCKKHLEPTMDIYIYGGEKAFCTPECRHIELVLDGVESDDDAENEGNEKS